MGLFEVGPLERARALRLDIAILAPLLDDAGSRTTAMVLVRWLTNGYRSVCEVLIGIMIESNLKDTNC